ncbi:outer membrane protein OmpA-like peptidoglycan-associated protein [Arcanobacterium wilhelmae]|uniref:Outer membrane protein OmpA-like peptidoglycan-associated protein n=1 Tax=Arcanobacterium wilhelmae TaxID=1803177 RepID=A0ABT9NAZ6_9ACTO|nr:OmpA family protein [Arcanobacterium wilhelmae]MDP9800878.1 outer membrane protein OmpA-like peptidoglycan-associated protein [Arcanobacterium wilhelmae]WFN90245.1 OmpA family protein [Arcanobacterium wilhelmae]
MVKRLKLALCTGVAVAALIAGCSAGASSKGSGSAVVASGSASSEAGGALDAGAATALVRSDLPKLEEPVGSMEITKAEGRKRSFNGGKIHVYSVRAGENSTRVNLAFTHPSVDNYVGDRLSYDDAPVLRADGKIYHPLALNSSVAGKPGSVVDAVPTAMFAEPRPSFVAYPPLPKGISEVEVVSPLSDQTVKVKVDRGPEKAPTGTADVPVLARNVALDVSNFEHKDGLITTIHGLTRTDRGVLLHYSIVLPEGARGLDDLGMFSSGAGRPSPWRLSLARGFSILDMQAKKYHLTVNELNTPSDSLPSEVSENKFAYTGWALFPFVDKTTTSVDIELSDNQLVQDVPISDSFPAGKKLAHGDFVKLGEGWQDPATFSPERLKKIDESISYEKTKIGNIGAIEQPVDNVYFAVSEGAVTETGSGVELDASVLFAPDQAELTSKAQAIIDRAVARIKAAGTAKVEVVGHTDSVADDAHNQKLSEARASAVAGVLRQALPGVEITASGKGEKEPVASNDTEQGRALNRRVAISWGGK